MRTCFQSLICSGGKEVEGVSFSAILSHLVWKFWVHKAFLLLLRLHHLKGIVTWKRALYHTPPSWTALFICGDVITVIWGAIITKGFFTQLSSVECLSHLWEKYFRRKQCLQLPVDWVLPVDVRSESLLSLETPAVIISTPSLSPLAHKQELKSVTSSNTASFDVIQVERYINILRLR